jgi:hypothetical protein
MERQTQAAPRAPEARAGLGLLEFLFAAAILAVFLGSLALSSRSMLGMGRATDVRATALEVGLSSLRTIVDDLRLSGLVGPTPYLYEDGAALAPFATFAHAAASENATPGEPDHGPNRELVFRLPADDDGDGEPDFDADGALLWDTRSFGYALVTAPDGVNQLERRIDGRTQRVVARHVERVVFDDITSSGFELGLGSIRVRLWLRLPDGNGGTHRQAFETTVGLRN